MGAYPAYKKDCEAMVFIDGWDVVAISNDGSVIDHGTAGTDDATVIQAAIDSVTSGTVAIMYSTYTIDTMITIEDNVKLVFDHNTIVKPASDIDMFYVKNGSRISGCKIDVSGVVGYSSSCILINGSEKISSQTDTKNSVQIENIWFYNDEYTGNAIFFDSEDATSGSIYGVIVDKIRIYKFEYGIRFYRTGVYGTNWINGNRFSNIRASLTRKLIYMETDTGVGSDLDGNMFTNIDMQSGGAPIIPAISIHGRYNILQNVMIWDWNVAWGPMFEFAANSGLNYVELNTTVASKYANNGSNSNTAFFPMNAEFNGLIKAPTAAHGTNTTQLATTEYVMDRVSPIVVTVGASNCDYTTLSAALAAITDASVTKRYCIQVCGYIEETSTIYAKDYVDVVGIGAYITLSGTAYVKFNGVMDSVWENLMIVLTGSLTASRIMLYIEGNTTGGCIIRNCILILEATGGFYSYVIGCGKMVSPTITGCKIIAVGGSNVNTCRGISCLSGSSPTIVGCDIENGKYQNNYGIFIGDSSSPTIVGCNIHPPMYIGESTGLTGASNQVLPFSGFPYYVQEAYVYCSNIGSGGGRVDIGTTPGGTDIVYDININTTGYKWTHFTNIVPLASDSPIYITIRVATDAVINFYYRVGYNAPDCNAVTCQSSGAYSISNCRIEANEASDGIYFLNYANQNGRVSNCHIITHEYDTVKTAYAVDSASVYSNLMDIYNCTFTGEVRGSIKGGIGDITILLDQVDAVLDKLGSPVLMCPCDEYRGTSIADYTRHSNNLTAIASLWDWSEHVNKATCYRFNGTSHYLYRANDTDFDFGDAATDDAFSIVCCVNPDDVTSRQIIGKWDDNNQREWRLFFDATGYPTFQLYDESADTYIGRQDQTVFTTGSWQVLVATYDGSGINAGCKIYIDGVQLDDADYDNGVYVAMEAVTANLMVGALKNAAAYSEYYDGKMTWIGVAAKELSADEVWSLTQRLKGVLGI
jgi:hypothetical protein